MTSYVEYLDSVPKETAFDGDIDDQRLDEEGLKWQK